MKNLRKSKFARAIEGSTGLEYALVAGFISVVIVSAATEIGLEVLGFFEAVVNGFH
jgi:Flp pilus assembly pilin Flp